MHFNFFPLGVPISSSVALVAGQSLTSDNVPTTSSYAEVALSPQGPTGPDYKIISGSKVAVISS